MGTTTFTGPIKAGNIPNTSGDTLGSDVKNVGDVVLAQTAPITQAGSATAYATNIVIPAHSHILNIQMLNTIAWTTVTNTMSVGTSVAANEIVASTAMALGLVSLTPGASAPRTANWDDTGPNDVRIWVDSAITGDGVGTLVVRYLQNHNN